MCAFSVASMAQTDVAAYFDMSLADGNTVVENVSKQAFAVNHNLAPENIDGAVGRALRFDGYSTYVKAQVNTSAMSTSTLSVSLWCAPETYPVMSDISNNDPDTWIVGNLDETARTGFAVILKQDGSYGVKSYSQGFPFTFMADGKLPRYEWSHIVLTFDVPNRTVTIYRNGEEVVKNTRLASFSMGTAPFYIGKSSEDVTMDAGAYKFLLNTFNGLIDDITIYNKVLTQAEAALPAAENAADLSIPASRYAADIMRPAYHGMPATAWTNECHGMAYSGGRYHVFFQKNANGPYMARLHWGHIYSDNLYKWHEDRIALTPGEAYDVKGCWSGAVFTDPELTGGKPGIIYTGVDNAKATINMALPGDDNLTFWTKQDGNPMINGRPSGLSDDFRDPYFFTSGGKKYIIVGSAKNGVGTTTLHEYNPETRTWSNDGRTFFSGTSASTHGTFWEMSNITNIDGKWLFTTTPLNTREGVEVLYWVGDISADGTFVPTAQTIDRPGKLELDGFSKQGYGLLSPTIFQCDGKTLLMGIVPDKLPSAENYELGWAHCYSLPREIALADDGTLIQRPYSGLQAMRTGVKYSRTDFDLTGTEPLDPVSGRKVELCGEFVVGSGDFGFNLFKHGDKQVKLFYSYAENTLTVDATGIDRLVNDGGVYDGLYRSTLPRSIALGEVMKVNVFVDHSIMDVFINDTWAFSMRLFPTDAEANGIEAFADGTTHVNRLEAWVLDEDGGTSSGITQAETHEGVNVSVADGMVVYDNAQAGAVLSLYDLGGNMFVSERLNMGGGFIPVAHRGVCIAKITTAKGVVCKKLVFN
mgnify:FL=1|jgi:beta-fructofuranosidase